MNHAETFFAAAAQICHDISFASIEALASELDRLRERKGRLRPIAATPEAFQAVVWHCLVSHPAIQPCSAGRRNGKPFPRVETGRVSRSGWGEFCS
jgi:hypothetical protein